MYVLQPLIGFIFLPHLSPDIRDLSVSDDVEHTGCCTLCCLYISLSAPLVQQSPCPVHPWWHTWLRSLTSQPSSNPPAPRSPPPRLQGGHCIFRLGPGRITVGKKDPLAAAFRGPERGQDPVMIPASSSVLILFHLLLVSLLSLLSLICCLSGWHTAVAAYQLHRWSGVDLGLDFLQSSQSGNIVFGVWWLLSGSQW